MNLHQIGDMIDQIRVTDNKSYLKAGILTDLIEK
jgi:hypothetical protein